MQDYFFSFLAVDVRETFMRFNLQMEKTFKNYVKDWELNGETKEQKRVKEDQAANHSKQRWAVTKVSSKCIKLFAAERRHLRFRFLSSPEDQKRMPE